VVNLEGSLQAPLTDLEFFLKNPNGALALLEPMVEPCRNQRNSVTPYI